MDYPGKWLTEQECDTLLMLGEDWGAEPNDVVGVINTHYHSDSGCILADDYADIRCEILNLTRSLAL